MPGTSQEDEMELLMVLVEDYDDKHYTIRRLDHKLRPQIETLHFLYYFYLKIIK